MARLGFIKRSFQDRRGVTATEFGLIAPTFLLLLMGVFDLGYNVYVRAILDGAVQKAGRDVALETGTSAVNQIHARVKDNLGPLANGATILPPELKNYRDFAKVGLPEDYSDTNKNNRRDPGECFTDENGNGNWDADLGKTGVGNARDVVIYRVTMKYERKFPLYRLMGISQDATIVSATALRNQPYGEQADQTNEVICT